MSYIKEFESDISKLEDKVKRLLDTEISFSENFTNNSLNELSLKGGDVLKIKDRIVKFRFARFELNDYKKYLEEFEPDWAEPTLIEDFLVFYCTTVYKNKVLHHNSETFTLLEINDNGIEILSDFEVVV